jgi:PleD family two-component response regulator
MPDAKVKLLIVDDEVSIRTSLSLIFTGSGHSVRSSADGFSALFEIRTNFPISFSPTSTCLVCLASNCSPWSVVDFQRSK